MKSQILVRNEQPSDIPAIRIIVTAAFAGMPYSSQTEATIVDALRAAKAITLSLVAVEGDDVVGHIAFSPITIDGKDAGWFGLGPLAVRTDRQKQGIGQALVHAGLDRLKQHSANGCVVLGDPKFYARFGFKAHPDLLLAEVPPEYFQVLSFGPAVPPGTATFHPAFAATNA